MNPATHTLVFDWGDTLMRVFPEASGPMAAWPQVEAMPGVKEALERLDGYHCIVATNAADSGAQQVRRALQRVGLDASFAAVFTARELGAHKPQAAFYHAIQSVLRQEPGQIVMIGDSYANDVTGAQQAGWSTVWYNPSGAAAPGLLPLQAREITRFEDLPQQIQAPALPGYATCLALLVEQALPHNLLAHVHSVAAAAYQMAVWLRASGERLDPLLAHRGALLHDLAKLEATRQPAGQRISHGELAARMLEGRGYSQLGEIARRHQLFSLTDPASAPLTWEQKLVYFADKLIENGHVVTLQERLRALRLRYPEDGEKISATETALIALQEEICAPLGFPANELVSRLREAFYAG